LELLTKYWEIMGGVLDKITAQVRIGMKNYL
jgi:hypothetical protein